MTISCRMRMGLFGLLIACSNSSAAEPSRVLFDFESEVYPAGWETTGEAFGAGPAKGTLPGQMPVTGFIGERLVNSFRNGDGTVGTLTSPGFTINAPYLNFLIGGGHQPDTLGVNLIVDGKTVATATGEDSEALSWTTWDVRPWNGKTARLQVFDKATGGWGHINLDQVELSSAPRVLDYGNPAISRAMASVHEATPRAEADPNRPAYHFRPPAFWMNDPNGPIQYQGMYHLFYQFNPYGDTWGNMHWAHARSKDLVHWEQLPIALWPSKEKGEDHVFSGCATIGPDGKPILFYTSIGRNKFAGDADQWAAVPADDDLITWTKHPASPVLTKKLHGTTTVHDWRDPFIFKDGDRTFMVLGGGIGDGDKRRGVVNLYESKSPELTDWTYRGVLWTHPELPNIECPLFFKLGDRFVLIISPHGKVQTFVGSFDPDAGHFTSNRRAILDEGQVYAPNVFFDKAGRALFWGWVNGFKSGNGWNGCMTLPRVLSLGPDDELLQGPAPETAALRGTHLGMPEWKPNGAKDAFEGPKTDSAEIVAEFVPGNPRCGFRLRVADDGKGGISVLYDGRTLNIAGQECPFSLREGEASLDLHLFLDRSVLEVFVNNRLAVTRVIEADPKALRILAIAPEGSKSIKRLDAWTIPAEGIFRDMTAPAVR